MWTYLTILFSLLILVAVFGRRIYLYAKRQGALKKTGVNEASEKVVAEDEEIREDAKKLSKSDEKEVVELCKSAQSALRVGKEDEAIKFFVQALALDELHVETQHKLAMLYMKKKMFSAASALFKSLGDITGEAVHYSHQGLALFPFRPQRFVSLAQVYRSLGQLNHAVVALNKALEIEAENLDFLFLLIDVQAELGNYNEALEIVGKVLEIDPKNEEAKSYIKTLKMEREKAK